MEAIGAEIETRASEAGAAAGGDGPLVLATERLRLRPIGPADADRLHRLLNDWEVCRMLQTVPFPYPNSVAEQWLASTAGQWRDGSAWHFAITGVEEGRELLVGAVGLKRIPKTRRATLGYWVGRKYWGHGVASEAAGRILRWALANLDLDAVEATVAADNPGSAGVLARIGFRETGTGRELFLSRGGTHPVRRFAATRADIPAVAVPPPVTEVAAPAPSGPPLLLVAACALVDAETRLLIARRPEGRAMAGLWEFPGGKLEAGESPEQAIMRELREELGIEIAAKNLAPFAFASHTYEKFHLLMPLYLCRRWQGIPAAREGQLLRWVKPEALADYPMLPADRPLLPMLRDFL